MDGSLTRYNVLLPVLYRESPPLYFYGTLYFRVKLKNSIDVICEKPLVLNSKDMDVLHKFECYTHATLNAKKPLGL